MSSGNAHILVIKLGALGDVLRTTSILPGLKAKYAGCRITWVTRRSAEDLIKNNALIDEIIFDDEAQNALTGRRFELVICLDDEIQACRWASEAGAQEIIGTYLEKENITYSVSSRAWFDMGLVSRFGKTRADELKKQNERTYQHILGEILGVRMSQPELKLDNEHITIKHHFVKQYNLSDSDTIIGLNTGAGERWRLKAMNVEKTINLAKMLIQETGVKVVLLGEPEEKERNKTILAAVDGIMDGGCNNSLLEFATLLDVCDIVITSDSLAMNMAIALKKKIIAFFGPTSANEIDLYGRGEKITAPMTCLCCYKKYCDIHPNCMELIDIREIIRLTNKLLHRV